MNLLLVEREELVVDNTVCLRDRRFEHLTRVLNVSVGQRIRAGIVRGPTGVATVVDVQSDQVALLFEASVAVVEPALDLVLALPRPKALSRMMQAAASFGVKRIDVINAWRVDASYFASHKVSSAALERDVRLGCEQGVTTYVPDVGVHRYFTEFVEGVLGPRTEVEPEHLLLIGHPSEPGFTSCGIEKVVAPMRTARVTLVIGPDGGFVESELRSLTALGGRLVSFGDTVLRSEIALVAGLSQIALLRRLRTSELGGDSHDFSVADLAGALG